MTKDIPEWIEERLAADPCVSFLGRRFRCSDDLFADPEAVVQTFGCVPLRGREYTLIEIRYTTDGYVGNFRELMPTDAEAGFALRHFGPLKGPHPERILRTDQSLLVTRAKFALEEYDVPGAQEQRYGMITRRSDRMRVQVLRFEERLLHLPCQRSQWAPR